MKIAIASVAQDLPSGFARLRADAQAEGFRQIERLVAEWESGATRFERDGERLIAARVGRVLAGIGGLTIDPVIADALRMRRFYVRPEFRRGGIGARLVRVLLAGLGADRLVAVNAVPRSIAFWEAQGFIPDVRDGHTHILRRHRR